MSGANGTLRLSMALACSDLRRDARFAACLVLAIAAVLGPLLVLFGLRYGLVESLRDELRRNPTTLELRPLTQGRFDEAFFSGLRALPDVAFVEPTPRFLATIMPLLRTREEDEETAVHVDMLPTSRGDPLLANTALDDLPPDGMVLSFVAAERLRAGPGDTLFGRFARVGEAGRDVRLLPLRVVAVLPHARLPREAALLPPEVLLASEDFRSGFATPLMGMEGRPPPEIAGTFAGFRLFARDIDGVEPLRAWLAAQGIRSVTAAGEISLIQRLDRALSLLFLVIAALGGTGAALGLAVSLWGNVERKAHELAVLRLIGFRSAAMATFPVAQALVVGALGTVTAAALAYAAGPVVRAVLRGTVAANVVSYRLPTEAVVVAAGLTLLTASLASVAAAMIAVRLDPATMLRRL
jgi:putative ABC transport system permease protein